MDDDSEGDLNFLTHKGKKLEELDDFKDYVSGDSADQYENKDDRKGVMNEEMVKALNFGGGDISDDRDAENRKKTREERHAEIMEKSKAFRLHHQEIKEATTAYTKELNDEFKDVAGLLTFNDKKHIKSDPKEKVDTFDNVLTKLKTSGNAMAQPMKMELSEKEKAQ